MWTMFKVFTEFVTILCVCAHSQTRVSFTAGRFFTIWAPMEALLQYWPHFMFWFYGCMAGRILALHPGEIQTVLPCIWGQSLNHWTPREVPKSTILTSIKCTYGSVALSTLTLWFSHYHHPSPEIFPLPQVNLWPHSTQTPQLRPQALAPFTLPSISTNLTTLGTSWEWSHTACVLLWPAYLTQHRVLEVYPGCHIVQNFFPV